MKTKFILIPLGIILAVTLFLSNVAMSSFFKRVFGDHYEIGILHIGPLKLPVSVADYGTKQEIWIRFPEEVWPSYRLSITTWDQTEEDIRILDKKIQEILEKIRKSAPGYSEEAARKSVEEMKTVQNRKLDTTSCCKPMKRRKRRAILSLLFSNIDIWQKSGKSRKSN